MISPYKKLVLRIDYFVQILFLFILFGSYGTTALALAIPFLRDLGVALVFPLLSLMVLAFFNPVMNIIQLVLGNYSEETRKLRKNYLLATLAYLTVGAVGYGVALLFPKAYFIINLGYFYIFVFSHLYALGYAYITVLENRTRKIVSRRLYY